MSEMPFPFGSVNRAIALKTGEGPLADALRDLARGVANAAPSPPFVPITTPKVSYVSPNGNDGTAVRGSYQFPFATINAALAAALDGDVVAIFPKVGGWAEQVVVPPALLNISIVGTSRNSVSINPPAGNSISATPTALTPFLLSISDISLVSSTNDGSLSGLALDGTSASDLVKCRLDNVLINTLTVTAWDDLSGSGVEVTQNANLQNVAGGTLTDCSFLPATGSSVGLQVTYDSVAAGLTRTGLNIMDCQITGFLVQNSPLIYVNAGTRIIAPPPGETTPPALFIQGQSHGGGVAEALSYTDCGDHAGDVAIQLAVRGGGPPYLVDLSQGIFRGSSFIAQMLATDGAGATSLAAFSATFYGVVSIGASIAMNAVGGAISASGAQGGADANTSLAQTRIGVGSHAFAGAMSTTITWAMGIGQPVRLPSNAYDVLVTYDDAASAATPVGITNKTQTSFDVDAGAGAGGTATFTILFPATNV